MGLGATQEMALDIFYGIWNNTVGNNSDSSDTIADISTSISILNMMSRASENVYLQEDVFPVSLNRIHPQFCGVTRILYKIKITLICLIFAFRILLTPPAVC